jgi:hypothetical protein
MSFSFLTLLSIFLARLILLVLMDLINSNSLHLIQQEKSGSDDGP